jgi:sirohydrochlorin cobaltochelatase
MSRKALVLAGHGSHISAETASVVWRYVDRLREMGSADEVTAAFWKEMPSFHTVLDTLEASNITIISMFTAQGYFSETVIPAEMGLTGDITQRDGRTIRYVRLSSHPALRAIVRRRVTEAVARVNMPADQIAIGIIGHSTRRNASSRRATEAQAAQIRELGVAREVVAVFLDDVPDIPSIYTLTSAPVIIAMPYFLAAGSHTTIDVPRQLGLPDGVSDAQVNGRRVVYTPPIGDEADVLAAVAEMYQDGVFNTGGASPAPTTESGVGAHLRVRPQAEAPGQTHRSAPTTDFPFSTDMPSAQSSANPWSHFPVRGRETLVNAVREQGELRFGQLRLRLNEVRPLADMNESPARDISTPSELRELVRENPFRPLATDENMPGGWRVVLESPEQLHAVVETVYPGAAAWWAANQTGQFTASRFEATLQRQQGDYRALSELTNEQRMEVIQQRCGRCVCHPTWSTHTAPLDPIPCPEPCNMWLSAALSLVSNPYV